MTALLHLHGTSRDASTAVLDQLRTVGLDVRSSPADAPSSGPVDVALIAPDVESPLQVARSIRRGAPDAHIVFLATADHEPELRRDLMIGGIGSRWSIGPAETPAAAADVVRQAIDGTERRRRLRRTIGNINTQLSNVTVPPRRAMISDHFLASVLDQLSDAIVVLDPAGAVLAFNDAASRAFGHLARGISFLDALPPAAGETIREAGGRPEGEAEALLSTADNREYGLRATSLRDMTGSKIGMALVAREVSGMRAAEKRRDLVAGALRVLASTLEAEATLQSLVELLTREFADVAAVDMQDERTIRRHAVAARNPDQQVLAEKSRGLDLSRHSAHPSVAAVERRESIAADFVDENAAKEMAGIDGDFAILRSLGRQSMLATPLLSGETAIGAIFVRRANAPFSHEDVETLEEIARQVSSALQNVRAYHASQEASRIKDEFLATLSHELRTPMTSILGWAQMLQMDLSDEKSLIDGLAAIEVSARAQAQLIDDLLDISRMQMGQLRLHVRTFAVVEVVRSSVETVRPAAQARGITIQVAASDPGVIAGDPDRLQQIMWNLLSNAVKFSERDGEVRVTVDVDDSQVVVGVADRGRGIDTTFLPYVFDRFRQGEAAVTRRFGGLGLGLAIVKQLVELHGGNVEARSDGPGLGSTFTVRFPLPSVVPAGEETVARRRPARLTPLDGIRVLLLEVDQPSTLVLTAILEKAGATIHHASTIEEALAIAGKQDCDVILDGRADPGDEGLRLIRELRASRGSSAELPAVALTTHDSPTALKEIGEAGFQGVLSKPSDRDTLTEMLATVVREMR
ncbi:MAG TPA: ATP-binding protein [Thermoanaerobaculia bacterium]